MRIIAQIRLRTDSEHKSQLRETMRVANEACNEISDLAWESSQFSRIALQKLVYYQVKEKYKLSAQMTLLCIRKVADAYRLDKRKKRRFGKKSAIAYDDRVLSFSAEQISIWTMGGRKKLSFLLGERQKALLEARKGESDLIYRNGEYYLHVGCELPEQDLAQVSEYLGVDLGIENVAVDSDGTIWSGELLERSRRRYAKQRQGLQKKGTRSARRKLCKIKNKESNFRRNENHRIAKRLVSKAKGTGRGIAMEDLSGISKRITVKKSQRSKHKSWAFRQLLDYVRYKATLEGVCLTLVDPKNTSRECPSCHSVDKRNRKSRSEFICIQCGFSGHADVTAAANIAARATVSSPIVAVA